MLTLNKDNFIYRYFSIDPGSNTLGLSIFELNLLNKRLSIIETITISGEKNSRYDLDYIDVHGNKTARLLSHSDTLFNLLVYWNPSAIICESAYMGRFPQAYAVLVETISYLKQAAFKYNPYMSFELIDPSTAKKNIKATIKGKDSVKESVLSLIPNEIDYLGSIPLNQIDEHGFDSISIGYYKYKQIISTMG